jgi:thioredoxin reductase
LSKKYKSPPALEPRFTDEDRHPKTDSSKEKDTKTKPSTPDKPNLHLASKEELMKELELWLEAEKEAELEEEDDDEAEFEHGWAPGDFPERVTIIGGGPAGIAAAIYASRAGLEPVVVAPPMGGQLQGKGVDVENYPGMVNVTGPAVIAVMRDQAVAFGTAFEAETVVEIDATKRPFKVITNSSVIETHAIIVATGAESNWLNVTGEYEMRGGGVSSCATCDGAIYHGKHVVVVGGGDTAMEDALVLARTSKSVTLVHRRDTFRASKILAQRVIEHPKITIQYNTIVEEILGEALAIQENDDEDDIDLDIPIQKVVTAVKLYNKQTNEQSIMKCDAVFVAIGHTPATSFLKGVVAFDPDRPGYVKVHEGSTRTSVPGIFAAGDVADSMYRQAITSAGSGAMAALDAERWLSEEGLGNEKEEFEAELLRELMGDDDEKDDIGYNAYDDVTIKGVKESVSATAGSEL